MTTQVGWKCKYARWVGLSEVTGHLVCLHPKKETFNLTEGEFGDACRSDQCDAFELGSPNAQEEYDKEYD